MLRVTIRGDVEKTAKREESWGPTRAAKCAPIDRFASWSTSFAWIMVILGSNLRSFLSSSSSSFSTFYHAYYRFHETPRCTSILFFHPCDGWKLLHIRMSFHFSILRLRIVVNLSFFFLSWNLKEGRKEGRVGIQNYFCNFWRIASSVNIHRRLNEIV